MTMRQLSRGDAAHTSSRSIVTALVERGLVDSDRRGEALAVVEAMVQPPEAESAPLRRRLSEVAGYVGGALVVAAAALFAADQWADLSTLQQVGLLLGVTAMLFAAGVTIKVTGDGPRALRAGAEPVRRRLAGVLFTAGAATATAAVVVWLTHVLQERGTEATSGHLIGLGGSLTLLLLALVGYLLAPTMLGQVAVAVGAAYAVPFLLDTVADVEPIPLGVMLLALGLGWLGVSERGVWGDPAPGRIIGAVLALVGAQIPVASDQPWVGYLLTVLLALAGFAMYVGRRAWPYLALGVAGLTLAVPEALLDWTEGSLGAAGVLLASGVTLLVASVLGLRLRREVARR